MWNSGYECAHMGCTKQKEQTNVKRVYVTMGNHCKCLEQHICEHTSQSAMLLHAQKLAHHLQTAINEREATKAQKYAKLLALENISVSISVMLKQEDEKDNIFRLKVNIEDRDTSGGSIVLTVRATDTIRDLKNKMFLKYLFPVEVQYWIIGKRIPQDSETLMQCRIKTRGYTAFLYLVPEKYANKNTEVSLRHQSNSESDCNALVPCFTPSTAVSEISSGASTAVAQGTDEGSGIPIKPKLEPGLGHISRNKLGLGDKAKTIVQEGSAPHIEKLRGSKSWPNQNKPIQTVLLQNAPRDTAPKVAAPVVMDLRVALIHQEEDEPLVGWSCAYCTFINKPTRPGCELCSNPRPADYKVPPGYIMSSEEEIRLKMENALEMKTREAQENERKYNFERLQSIDNKGIIPNTETFTCSICFEEIGAGQGITLRECLHTFCRDCLKCAIVCNEDPVQKCPYQDDSYSCTGVLQDREVKALVTNEVYSKYLARSLALAERQAQNSFHCKTSDCLGWCIYEDHVNFFLCPVCCKENCLTCKAIHQDMNCRQYQDDVKKQAVNDKAASKTQLMIRKMLDDGDAMSCPHCQVIVMKKEGCDWIQCSICKTEICWVTKGPRWGPEGNGDLSGGCRCRLDGVMCHPNCNNCH